MKTIIRSLLKISFNTFISFCVIDFIFILIQAYWFSTIKEKPEIYIGIPKSFYIFSLDEEMNYRTQLEWKYLFYDLFIFWIVLFILFSIQKIKKYKILNQKHYE